MAYSHQDCADACAEVIKHASHCLEQCIDMEGMGRCPHLQRDAVAVATACLQLCAAGSDMHAHLCRACAEICEEMARVAGGHDHDHCQDSAAAARRCAEICRAMAA